MRYSEKWDLQNVHYGDGIVIEDGRDIFGGELVRSIADEEACLSDSTITDNHTPTRLLA